MIGGKWKALILWHLRSDTMRFAELPKVDPLDYATHAHPSTP
ncbi:MAG TPA: winged helix-turn-helix transcriptional regulator [Nitrospira sp.]|nr:winged helix-turn-helix transcriptional regulator [Nitrospira sp.]